MMFRNGPNDDNNEAFWKCLDGESNALEIEHSNGNSTAGGQLAPLIHPSCPL